MIIPYQILHYGTVIKEISVDVLVFPAASVDVTKAAYVVLASKGVRIILCAIAKVVVARWDAFNSESETGLVVP